MAAEKLLRETLNDLSSEEFNKFKSLVELEESFSAISRSRLEVANKEDVVELMMEAHDQPQWVEVTRKVLKKMNRPDLVRRLSEDSSGIKETQQPTLTQRVETMTSVIELLLETLIDLTDTENLSVMKYLNLFLLRQTHIHSRYSAGRWRPRQMTDLVFLMVKTFGRDSVMKTMEVLKKIKRTDLVQRLSDRSSISKKKRSDDKYSSALIHKVATMVAVKELLLETLCILNHKELEKFKLLLHFTRFQRGPSLFPWSQRMSDYNVEIADLMMEQYGHQSVEVIMEVLMDMNRMDLVQKLTESSSKLKESSAKAFDVKTTEEEHCSELIQKVETMTSVIEQLLETLADFGSIEIKHFMEPINYQKHYNYWRLLEETDVQDCVFVIVEIYGQHSVEKVEEILEKMKKTDFVQRLSDTKLRPQKKTSVDKPPAALIHKVATLAAVKQLLLETLNDLSYEEFRLFKDFLQFRLSQENLRCTMGILKYSGDRAEVVHLMLEAHGQQSVEVTKKIFMKMNRTDLVKRFSGTSSGLKVKQLVYEPGSALFERVPATDAVEKILVGTLRSLSNIELTKFKWLLQFMYFQKGIPQIPEDQQEWGDRTVRLNLMKRHGQQSVEVMREILKDMNRTDLVERLSKTSLGPTVSGAELDSSHKGDRTSSRGPSDKDPSDWTKLDPEVKSTHTDEAPTYSLQSEAGNFECSISGLRWSCKGKVSFKYQFCSWEEHMERMENMQYMPAGPLIDMTVIVGKLDEVYLPHWICIDNNTKLLDKFAVLHIDDCGDVVEKVSEVLSSHVKLSEPVFSPRAVLMKAGFPVKINCNVLIYYNPNKASLTLHVYLIPHDLALKQTVDKNELSRRYEIILKPRPDKYLKMQQRFKLTADIDTAIITTETITLRYESQDPNFYEVYIENPDRNFCLTLSYPCTNRGEPKWEPVWTCEIRKDDFSNCGAAGSSGEPTGKNTMAEGGCSDKHFVDKHKVELIRRVSNIASILDELLDENIIQQEVYDQIRVLRTPQDKMRELLSGPLKASVACKDAFYKILEKNEPFLIKDLKENN